MLTPSQDLESQEDTDHEDNDVERQHRLHDFRDFVNRDGSRMASMSAVGGGEWGWTRVQEGVLALPLD